MRPRTLAAFSASTFSQVIPAFLFGLLFIILFSVSSLSLALLSCLCLHVLQLRKFYLLLRRCGYWSLVSHRTLFKFSKKMCCKLVHRRWSWSCVHRQGVPDKRDTELDVAMRFEHPTSHLVEALEQQSWVRLHSADFFGTTAPSHPFADRSRCFLNWSDFCRVLQAFEQGLFLCYTTWWVSCEQVCEHTKNIHSSRCHQFFATRFWDGLHDHSWNPPFQSLPTRLL